MKIRELCRKTAIGGIIVGLPLLGGIMGINYRNNVNKGNFEVSKAQPLNFPAPRWGLDDSTISTPGITALSNLPITSQAEIPATDKDYVGGHIPNSAEARIMDNTLKNALSLLPKDLPDRCIVSRIQLEDALTIPLLLQKGDKKKVPAIVDGAFSYDSRIVYINSSSNHMGLDSAQITLVHEIMHACASRFMTRAEEVTYEGYNLNPDGRHSYKGWDEIMRNGGLDDQVLGFARRYGTSNINEDIATMSVDVILRYDQGIQKSKKDRIYAEKFNMMADLITRWSGGEMDRDYFSSLFKHNINKFSDYEQYLLAEKAEGNIN